MPVPVTTLEFFPYTKNASVRTTVYLKEHWQGAWQEIPYLWCDQATWCCAPSIPTAQLDWDVGKLMRQGEQQAGFVPELAVGRYFVKIETSCHTAAGTVAAPFVSHEPDAVAKLKWFGTIEVTQEVLEGIDLATSSKTGHQKLPAFGLAQMLSRTPLDGHWWTETAAPTSTHFSEHPGIFNRADAQGRIAGNRSAVDGLYFSDKVLLDDLFWSSRDIVHYLLHNHPPRETADPMSYVFLQELVDEIVIPDWDKPLLSMSGKSVWQVLCEVLHRGRLLTFHLEVNEDDPADPIVELVPISLAGSDITTDEGTILANQRQFHLNHHRDRGVLAALRTDTLQAVDQFTLRGARRASIVSIGYADAASASTAATLAKGWNSAQETEYEAGGSGDAGYAAASNEEKQRRNAQARAREEVFPVYRRFQIPDAWSVVGGMVRDGRGGTTPQAAFVKDLDRAVGIIVNPRELRILPTLPLKDGYDYSGISSLTAPGIPTRVSLGPHENLRPQVFFKIPDQTTRWIEASQIGKLGKEETGQKQNHKMSVRVEVPVRDKAILLEVNGPQHAIAFADFSKLTVDPHCGEWDWQTAVFTIALEDDRHCEGKWPDDASLAVHTGELRRAVIDVGNEYRTDYIAPHTVLSVNKNDGTLVECTAGGYFQDDRKTLEAKAKLAHSYYSQGRSVLALSCDRPHNCLLLGDYIATTSLEMDDVGSIVTQLTLRIPASQEERILFDLETAHAELDFLENILEKNRMY